MIIIIKIMVMIIMKMIKVTLSINDNDNACSWFVFSNVGYCSALDAAPAASTKIITCVKDILTIHLGSMVS